MTEGETTRAATLTREEKRLAAITYAEASALNSADEAFAIASVLVRQRDARGYAFIDDFMTARPSFAYGARSPKHDVLMAATEQAIEKSFGMRIAVSAARNALAHGLDRSNGAYFWDGYDIRTNYAAHPKVLNGIRITDPTHNVHGISDSTRVRILFLNKVVRDKATGKEKQIKQEKGRYDQVYESTAAYGGTVFWKFSAEYLRITGSREYG